MSWTVTYDSDHDIIHAVYAGHVTADDFKAGTIKTIALSKAYKTKRILIDDSHLESAVSITEIYDMPNYYHELEGTRRSKMALILPPSGRIRKDVLFYETVCRNRGWRVKGFNEHKDALEWLLC